jgi:hypothetical protein
MTAADKSRKPAEIRQICRYEDMSGMVMIYPHSVEGTPLHIFISSYSSILYNKISSLEACDETYHAHTDEGCSRELPASGNQCGHSNGRSCACPLRNRRLRRRRRQHIVTPSYFSPREVTAAAQCRQWSRLPHLKGPSQCLPN